MEGQKQLLPTKPHKLLIMGDTGVGKTSIFAVIFSEYSPENTFLLGWTNGISSSNIEFGIGIKLQIEDCGGQEKFKEEYFGDNKKNIFEDVKILIFVIEATEDKGTDLSYYESCLKALREYSPNAKVFVFIHKMDLIEKDKKKVVYEKKRQEIIGYSSCFDVKCFATSIWEKSLYTAWKHIIGCLMVNLDILKKGLDLLREACDADKVVIFEKSTLLFLCSSSRGDKNLEDDERFDQISISIKKMMKSSINLGIKGFLNLKFVSKKFTVYLDEFTKNTLVLIFIDKSKLNIDLLSVNIDLTRKKFISIISQSQSE